MGEYGNAWEFDRIGAERERMSIEKEMKELEERLAKVQAMEKRKDEIENELKNVLVHGGDLGLAVDYEDKQQPSSGPEVEIVPELVEETYAPSNTDDIAIIDDMSSTWTSSK